MILMQTLYLILKHADCNTVELRYRLPGSETYESCRLALSEIQTVIDQGEPFSYVSRPNYPEADKVGHNLFCWLDGDGQWLSQGIQECPQAGLVLAIQAEGSLGHLPWEMLHDGQEFLVERTGSPIVPLRWIGKETSVETTPVKSPLQVLFMAASAEGVIPAVDFEEEEARILKITDRLPLNLHVEDSGCVEELGRMWQRFPEDTFQVFHLAGHASIQGNETHHSYFNTETLTGKRYYITAKDLLQVFEYRLPRLVFLSGCCTGQSRGTGAVSFMAETLVKEGMPAVLCWGGSVLESTATLAAAHFYGQLAEGRHIAQALGSTYRELRKKKSSDWHLMQLYALGKEWGPVAVGLDGYVGGNQPAQTRFLDANNQVVVVASEDFVGRRRLLQDCLGQLQSRECLGILLHGLGGVGKSTVAARLLDRLAGYTPIVICEYLRVDAVERLLAAQCVSEDGKKILNSDLPPRQRLMNFLRNGLNTMSQRFCFILDSFEANLEAGSDGTQKLRSAAVEPLMTLLHSINWSNLAHRVIITSRFDLKLPILDHRLQREQVEALRGADLAKKYRRLRAFHVGSDLQAELQAKGKRIADGNPRLLEWLSQVLLVEGLDKQQILSRMDIEEACFRESILAEELLKQQPDGLVNMLSRLKVFELPVPEAAISAVCDNVIDLEAHRERAVALGLIEVSRFQGDMSYRVPRIVAKLLHEVDRGELIQKAADAVYKLWSGQTKSEEQYMEVYRLGEMSGKNKICIHIGTILSHLWLDKARYSEALKMEEEVLKIRKRNIGGEDPGVASSLRSIAFLHFSQGHYDKAESLYVESLKMRRRLLGDGHKDVATGLSDLAALYVSQRRYSKAESLYMRSLKIIKRLRGQQHADVAKTLDDLASLYLAQKLDSKAEALYKESLQMRRRIHGEEDSTLVETLTTLGGLCSSQGRYSEAKPLYVEALAILKRLLGEEHPVVQSVLRSLALLYEKEGYLGEAERLCVESLEITTRTQGEEHPEVAVALEDLARMYINQRRHLEAEVLILKHLVISKRVFGQHHTKTAGALELLALLYDLEGQHSRSEALYKKSLEMRRRLLGEDHLDVASSLSGLAGLYIAHGRLREAEPVILKFLEISKRFGKEDFDVAGRMYDLGTVCQLQKRFSEAEAFYAESLEMRRRLYGEEHADVSKTLDTLGHLYISRGRYWQAEPLLKESLEMKKRLLGEEHPDVALILNHLASISACQKRYSEAEQLFVQSLQISERCLGENHPDVAKERENLASLYAIQGRHSEAERCLARGLSIAERLGEGNRPHAVMMRETLEGLRRLQFEQ